MTFQNVQNVIKQKLTCQCILRKLVNKWSFFDYLNSVKLWNKYSKQIPCGSVCLIAAVLKGKHPPQFTSKHRFFFTLFADTCMVILSVLPSVLTNQVVLAAPQDWDATSKMFKISASQKELKWTYFTLSARQLEDNFLSYSKQVSHNLSCRHKTNSGSSLKSQKK